MKRRELVIAAVLLIVSVNVFAAAPVVIEAVPDNGETNVNPSLNKIKIVFDQDMTTGQTFSICGGGDKFPNIAGNPKWIGKRTLVMSVKLKPNKEYQFSINCQSAGNCKSVNGVSAVPYPISFKTGSGGGGGFKPNNEFEEKISKINIGKSSLEDAAKLFGDAESYRWGDNFFDRDNLPGRYVASYADDFHVVVVKGVVDEIRFEKGSDFSFNGIKIGSSLIETIKVLGRPGKQVKGKSNEFADNTLYRNINGRKGFCYYARSDQGVRCFFANNKVSAIYLTAGGGGGGKSDGKTVWTIHFVCKGGFNPTSPNELLEKFNKVTKFKARTHHFKFRKTSIGVAGTIMTDSTDGKNTIKEMLKNSRSLEFIKAVR